MDRLKHDIERHLAALSAEVTESARLRVAIQEWARNGYLRVPKGEVDALLAEAADETTAARDLQCPVHWTYENGLRIRCKKALGHSGNCDLG